MYAHLGRYTCVPKQHRDAQCTAATRRLDIDARRARSRRAREPGSVSSRCLGRQGQPGAAQRCAARGRCPARRQKHGEQGRRAFLPISTLRRACAFPNGSSPTPARAPLEPDFWHDCLSISEPVRPPRSARQSENPCHTRTHTHTHTHTLTQGKPKAHGPLARNAFSQISRRALPVPAKGIKAPPRPPPSPNFSSCISHPLRHQPHTAHQQHTRNIINNNGPHQADRSQVHWWQGSSQAACLQGW